MINKLLILLLISNSFADEEVVYLEKGKQSPYTGYLFTPEKADSIRKQLIEGDTYKLLNQSLEKSLELEHKTVDLSNLKITNLSEQNDKLAKSLYEERSMSNWERIGFFALGVIGTGLAVYGIKQATK